MADAEYVARIRAYLEQHKATYDRDALRQKLVSDGHPAQIIDVALAQVYGFNVAPNAPPVQRDSALPLVLTIVGVFVLNYLLLGLAFALLVNSDTVSPAYWALLLLVPIEIAAGIAVWRRNHPVGRGIIWGLVASLIPILGAALLFGICLALIGGA